MKIKKLFVAIAVSMFIVLGFTGCLGNGSGSESRTYVSPAVIEYGYTGAGILLNTAYGVFIPDNASASSLSALTSPCAYMSFEYNSEYQTSGAQYPVASNIRFEPVGVDYIHNPEYTLPSDNYDYPFSSVEFFTESFSTLYKGKFFIYAKAKLDTNQALEYYLYYKSWEQPEGNGARNIYLQAHLPGTASGTQDVGIIRALDMRSMMNSLGRDTTIREGSTDYSLKYLKINLKYCSAIENDEPVFKSVNTQPVEVYVFKDDL
ncbi:hypothetical protein FACS189451_01610 [Bacteroidia bacterium]|nr:hypothetical protein FACS189451_01610 [Bacteroidia bacterium]